MMLESLQEIILTLGPLSATSLLGFTVFLLLLWRSIQKQSYWKKQGIPYVKPVPFFGSFLEMLKKPVHDMELDRYMKYGRIYGHYEGNTALLSVGEPEILRHIFVKDFNVFTGRRDLQIDDDIMGKMMPMARGEDWKRIRTTVTPTFTTGKIKKMLSIFKECSCTLAKNYKEAATKGEPIDVKRFYNAFTMDIIASSAFSTKIDSHNDPNNPFVVNAREITSTKMSWRLILIMLFPRLMELFKISVFPNKVMTFFTNVTLQIMEERKSTGQTRNDFLQLLMDTAKEVGEDGQLDSNEKDELVDNYGKQENDQMFKQNIHAQKTLTPKEVIAQCIIFFLAGSETTASTLAFASYCLALNPEIQEKLIQELDDALRKNNGDLTYEAIQSMKYLDNVISETLRLYPPNPRIERMADENYKLGDTGITIPKGMVVSIPVYAIHRDPELYPNPEKFDPDRFSPEERSKRNQYAFIPFGHGPRNCVAMRFALMEVKVCLAHVLANFRIKRCPQTKVPLQFSIIQAQLYPTDITLAFEIRTDAVKVL